MSLQVINLGTLPDGRDGDTNRTAFQKTNENMAAIGGMLAGGYIEGLRLQWISATSLRIGSGAAFVPSVGGVVILAAAATLSGLSLTANTWYHVYLTAAGGVEAVATAPAAPYFGTARAKTGDNTRRYIGSVRADASGGIIQFVVDSALEYRYLIPNPSQPLRVLSNGKAVSRTTVSCSGPMPVTATHAILLATNTDPAIYLNLSIPGAASPSIIGIAPNSSPIISFPTNTSQQIDYYYSVAPAGGAYIDIVGFAWER